MTLNWTLLLDADMSQQDIWHFSQPTDAEILRIDQENPPDIGRFALAQTSLDQSEFLQTNAYPARTESFRINLQFVGTGSKLIAVRHRYSQFSDGQAENWRIKVYGAKANFEPPINPSAVLITLDPRIAGAIPLEEKGLVGGVAELDASGIVPEHQLPPWGDLIGANLAATDALAIRIEEFESPTLSELGGEPAGAEQRANEYTDLKISEIPPPIAPTLAELGGEPAGAETRAKNYTDSLLPALIARLDKLESDYPSSFTYLWGYGGSAYNGSSQKSFNNAALSGIEFYRSSYLDPSQLGDTIELEFPLKSGNYKLELLYGTGTNRGIASIYFNDSLIGTLDSYSSSGSNQIKYNINFSASTSGRHKLKIVIANKNTSSSGYRFSATALFINPTPVLPPTNLVLINCGDQSNYTANDGRIWSLDQYFSGGIRTDIEAALGQTITIQNTQNQRLYKYERALDNGTFTYSIPINQPGTFTVKLLFCENYHSSAGQRVGSVAINGVNYLSNFDIFAEAGGKHTALVKAWNNVVMSSSTVTISVSNTLINGIELVRSS